MENIWIPKYDMPWTILPSVTDSSGKLSIPDCFSLFMDAAAVHAPMLKCGTEDLAKQGLFWLTVRSKIKIIRRPRMMEEVVLSTWPEEPQETRCNRDYSITKDGEPLVLGKTLWAVLNIKTNRLHKVDVLYPEGFKAVDDLAIPEPFTQFDKDFQGEEFAAYTVRSTDIDFGGHMNNIAYIRAIESLFLAKEWQDMQISEMEIHYKTACYEGDVLTFQKKAAGDSLQLAAFLPNGKVAVYASLKSD
ncbi:MAG: hypothetical protein IIY19_00700 [Lachnospiraceae bacterium]|nr:hypothetical protein [Lachnospiraceae bacterium]